jgi:hypothetical protein
LLPKLPGAWWAFTVAQLLNTRKVYFSQKTQTIKYSNLKHQEIASPSQIKKHRRRGRNVQPRSLAISCLAASKFIITAISRNTPSTPSLIIKTGDYSCRKCEDIVWKRSHELL